MYIALIIILAILVCLFISVAEVYRTIPLIELKRRARSGQQPAKSLYKVASYKYSSQLFLLFLASIASAAFFVLLSRKSPIWVALAANFSLIWLAYIWIPRSSINIVSQYFAQILARPIGWLLQYIHPLLSYFHVILAKPSHTGLYESSDILRLLKAQQKQNDNRIEEFELDLIKHVIDFGTKRVIDVMTPKRKVHAIPARETLGPIVLNELHKTKHNYFPVYEEKPSDIVGIISLFGLSNSKITVNVYDAMNQTIYYVHEEQYLSEVLQVMLKSSQEFFIVINNFGEYSGIITARDILKNLVGETITDEFDQYDSKELVSKRFASSPEVDNNIPEHITEVLE